MYTLKPLPYSYSSLEPFIDTHTLGLHHRKHQENYLNKLNALLEENHYNYQYPLEELATHLAEFPKEVRPEIAFNLGGVLNHNLYFGNLSPKGEKPSTLLLQAIENKYGSFEEFKKKFKEKALSLKGSGYTILVLQNGQLEILNFPNQETPYTYHLIPLITLDVWEHAYYLNYENKRDLYIDNFFEILDWHHANTNFQEVSS